MATSKSEDILGQKWDRCVADTLIKIGGGLTLGVVFSAIIFKRRPWPLIFGLGAGAGMGYANCQHEFDEPFLVKAEKIFVKPKIPAAPEASPTEAQ
ncbi:MICOS complex subunit Mic10-like [Homarus americanus]|uniref:MICOS complex subunit Mic10-like n=1 Tax=Homarus americanus TaxID=6706 RepID=UPI001C480862|nr:MICOS complex subunit Mic10-like [Homarus americanus]